MCLFISSSGHGEGGTVKVDTINLGNMIASEVVLTLGLAGVLYYEGEVSSQLAIIKVRFLYLGNQNV